MGGLRVGADDAKMGRFDIRALRYLSKDEMRTLSAVEMGMRNHEMVPVPLICSIAGLRRGGTKKILPDLMRVGVIAHEASPYDGFRLTNLGYDFLALKSLSIKTSVSAVGSKIGVGKESDIYIMTGPDEVPYAMKLHRLGRTCFRSIKNNRDYLKGRQRGNWLYMARLAAEKEYKFITALHKNGFPVPTPIDHNRHIVVMELVEGYPLTQVRAESLLDPGKLYATLMDLILRFANQGLIHGDYNEFNIMLKNDDTPVILDFPQMVSTNHPNAKWYFDRDVTCIRDFFRRKYHFESEEWPEFDTDVNREGYLDVEVEASGFNKESDEDLDEMLLGDTPIGEDASDSDGSDGRPEEARDPDGEDERGAESIATLSLLVDSVAGLELSHSLEEVSGHAYWTTPLVSFGSLEDLVVPEYELQTEETDNASNKATVVNGVVSQIDYLAEDNANTNRDHRPYRIGEEEKQQRRKRYLDDEAEKQKQKATGGKGPMDIADVRSRLMQQTGSRNKRNETGRAVHLHRNSSKNKNKRTNANVIKESGKSLDDFF